MATLDGEVTTHEVTAISIRFAESILYIALSDGREIGVPLERYRWLTKASPAQRAKWSIEPGGFAVYWEELDDGLEICHLLSTQPLA